MHTTHIHMYIIVQRIGKKLLFDYENIDQIKTLNCMDKIMQLV